MDLSALPTKALLRWDLTLRLFLALMVPLLVGYLISGGIDGLVAGFIAAFVTISYLGPDVGDLRWSSMTAILVPGAFLAGAAFSQAPWGFALIYVFVLYAALGAFILAGLVPQLAFTPVAAAGLISSVLIEDGLTLAVTVNAVAGSLWAMVLMLVIPRWVPTPQLPIPPGALAPRMSVLRRMRWEPNLRDWGFPLLLGSLSALVLAVSTLLTDNSRPYWAVFAFVSVLGPAAAKTRKIGWQTVASAIGGVLVAIVLIAVVPSDGLLIFIVTALGMVGALLLLKNGALSKLCFTPLPIVLISILLGEDAGDVASLRLFEYVFGVLAAILVASLAEYLASRIEEERPAEQSEIAG